MRLVYFSLFAIFTSTALNAKGPEHCSWHNENQYWCYPLHSETSMSYADYYFATELGEQAYYYVSEYLDLWDRRMAVDKVALYEDWILRSLNNGLKDENFAAYDGLYEVFMKPEIRSFVFEHMLDPIVNKLSRRPWSNNLQNNVSLASDRYDMQKIAHCMLTVAVNVGNNKYGIYTLSTVGDRIGVAYPRMWCAGSQVEYYN